MSPRRNILRAGMVVGMLLLGMLLALALGRHLAWPVAAGLAAAVAGGIAIIVTRRVPLARPPVDPEPPADLPVARLPASQDLLEHLPDPVILLDGARQVVAVNRLARDVLGIGLLGRDLALSIRHPTVLAAVEAVAQGLPSLTEEITLPVPVPRTFTLHTGRLAPSADPEAPSILLVLRDETRAKRAEQSRADFVANATHELRSPLSALIGFIETLRGPASDDSEARERFLGVMHAEGQRMARLVEDLMSLARVEINEHVPPRDHVDLADVLLPVADALAGRAQQRQMTIRIEGLDDLPPVIGDADQLTQVFHNLVDNSIKYARAGSEIVVTVSRVDRLPGTQSPAIAVSVRDSSDGIPLIHLPRVTERFYRADEGRSRRLGGTGLGLAIVKHIVNRHRGRLSVESDVGVGSTFTVSLPQAPAAGPTGGSHAERRESPTHEGPAVINV